MEIVLSTLPRASDTKHGERVAFSPCSQSVFANPEPVQGVVPGGRDDASWLSVIFISWMNPLVRLAYDRSLEMKNLFPIPDKSKPESLLKNFDEAWGEQMKLPKGKRRWDDIRKVEGRRERRKGQGLSDFISVHVNVGRKFDLSGEDGASRSRDEVAVETAGISSQP